MSSHGLQLKRHSHETRALSMTGGAARVTEPCLLIRAVTEGFTAGMSDTCRHNLNEQYQRTIATHIYHFRNPKRASGHEQL